MWFVEEGREEPDRRGLAGGRYAEAVAAILSRRPLVLLEQNAEPGLTTTSLSRRPIGSDLLWPIRWMPDATSWAWSPEQPGWVVR